MQVAAADHPQLHRHAVCLSDANDGLCVYRSADSDSPLRRWQSDPPTHTYRHAGARLMQTMA
jgi:hypothetical protein